MVDGFEALGNAVIAQAVEDYVDCRLKRMKAETRERELKLFFSEGGGMRIYNRSEITGDELLYRCNKIVDRKFDAWRKQREKKGDL